MKPEPAAGPEPPVGFGPAHLQHRLAGLVGRRRRSLRSLPLRGKVALVVVVLIVLIGIFGTIIAPYPPDEIGVGPLASPPQWPHIFGTDVNGRDSFSRVIVATRISVIAGFTAPVAALLIGGTLGAIAAAYGRVDEVIMRLMDIQFAFPAVVLALVFASVLGPSLRTTTILMAIIYSPIMARLVRANVLEQLSQDYVAAERSLGSSTPRILARHVAINISTPTLVFFTLVAADAIVLEAGLSFLGAGVRPPTASWGNLVQEGSQQMLAGAWWLTVFPGLAILVAVLALNTLAESIADQLGGRQYLLGEQ